MLSVPEDENRKRGIRASTMELLEGSESEEGENDSAEETEKEMQESKEKAEEKMLQKKYKRDFLVNAGFSFEITDYFKFESKTDELREKTFFKHLSQQHYLSWIVLLYSVISSAMIPPWLMSIKANKLLRISWRCLLQLIIIVPFVLFEKRAANEKVMKQYTLAHIFEPKHIKKIFIASFTGAFFVTTILTTIEWTYISHSMVLGALANFVLSMQRTVRNENGQIEKSGEVLIILGICFVIYDSVSLEVDKTTSFEWNVYNYFYLTREWWQRVLGDLGALAVAYCMAQLSKQTSDLKEYYPPYLSMFLNNIFTCIFVIFSGFFFNGVTFDFNSQWGVFALFTDTHFTNFLYMSILLGMGVFISFVMVSKMFPDPIVPALAMTLEPIISTVLFHLVGVQTMPGSYACFGYLLIVPGIIVILVGNCLFTRKRAHQTQIPLLPITKASVPAQNRAPEQRKESSNSEQNKE